MRRTFLGLSWRAMTAALAVPLALLARSAADAGPDDLPSTPPLTAVELDQLVAPVALYPDEVLDALLPATTAPSDIAAAAVFVGDADVAISGAPVGTSWDVSVVALLQFPEVVRWMGENPAWVERTGYAVAMQQADLLAAVQRYRARAQAAGALTSNDRVTVAGSPQTVIVIRSVTPDVVYVPVYDPWALDAWSVGTPFFTSWLSFSFGGYGLWGRHRIFWGSGIYAYGDAWWGGTWRSRAADWGTRRPARWSARYRADQPWTRGGWGTSAGSTRVTSTRLRRDASSTRVVNVAPPPSSRSSRYAPRSGAPTADGTTRTRRDPTVTVAPAAPVTRWTAPSHRSPRSVAPTTSPTRRTAAPSATPRFTTPAPNVLPRRTVDAWRTRGGDSLDSRIRRAPSTTPGATPRTAPATRVVPSVPRVTPATPAVPRVSPAVPASPARAPRTRAFPPVRPKDPPLDGARVRATDHRGRSSLSGA